MQVKVALQRLIILIVISTVSFVFVPRRQTGAVNSALSISIPKVWDDAEIATVELPLADAMATPKHITADYYYRIPIRPIYKSYPVYALGREPLGYQEWLNQQEPQTVFDLSELKTEEDWTRAGEIVFDAPIFYDAVVKPAHIKDPKWYESSGVPWPRTVPCPISNT